MDNEKRLNLMRFWLFGTFLIVISAILIFVGGVLGTGFAILGQLNFWLAVILIAVLCVICYYVYRWYLGRKE